MVSPVIALGRHLLIRSMPRVVLKTSLTKRILTTSIWIYIEQIISKTIDGVKVLDNVSFIVGHDDKIAFVGSNELATTTLFNIITGNMEPDEGTYKWGVTTSQGYFPKDSAAEFNREDTMSESSENLYSCDVLIIDDLGTEFVNSYTSAKLFTCINERLIRGGSTIISTNLSLQELLEIYSERTFSRISMFTIMKLFGDDIRIMNKAL